VRVEEKVLNLEELADEIVRVEYPTYENAPSGMREAIIRKKQMMSSGSLSNFWRR